MPARRGFAGCARTRGRAEHHDEPAEREEERRLDEPERSDEEDDPEDERDSGPLHPAQVVREGVAPDLARERGCFVEPLLDLLQDALSVFRKRALTSPFDPTSPLPEPVSHRPRPVSKRDWRPAREFTRRRGSRRGPGCVAGPHCWSLRRVTRIPSGPAIDAGTTASAPKRAGTRRTGRGCVAACVPVTRSRPRRRSGALLSTRPLTLTPRRRNSGPDRPRRAAPSRRGRWPGRWSRVADGPERVMVRKSPKRTFSVTVRPLSPFAPAGGVAPAMRTSSLRACRDGSGRPRTSPRARST